MEPALESGDWLLVDPHAYARRPATIGDLVLVPDPRQPNRLVVKRIASVLANGDLELLGDAPGASTDSRTFGTVRAASVVGRPWFRYWPLSRSGRLP